MTSDQIMWFGFGIALGVVLVGFVLVFLWNDPWFNVGFIPPEPQPFDPYEAARPREQIRAVFEKSATPAHCFEDYAVRVSNPRTGKTWIIYQDGQTEGWEDQDQLVVFNKIPSLIEAAAQLGYSEAESLRDIPEADKEWFERAVMKNGRKQER